MIPKFKMTPQIEQIISEILSRKNSVEIRQRKDCFVIMEISGKQRKVIPFDATDKNGNV